MTNPYFRADRRLFLTTASVGMVAASAGSAWAAGSVLPAPQSLTDELAKALEKGNPLVVMVSLEGLPVLPRGAG